MLAIFLFNGHFTQQPNIARVLMLFGAYRGTVRESGFHWTNPLYIKQRISLRSRNLTGEKLKVNDKRGNPIEIAAVVVWRVQEHRPGVFRRRKIRGLRSRAVRVGRAAFGQQLSPTITARSTS